MEETPDAIFQSQQTEVQRLMGQTILRLQSCEQLVKTLISHYKIDAPFDALESAITDRTNKVSRQTLGGLVSELLGSYLIVRTSEAAKETESESGLSVEGVRMLMTLEMEPDDHRQMTTALSELVALRNALVHGFLEQHDLSTREGCTLAENRLTKDLRHIGEHRDHLKGLVKHMIDARQAVSDFLGSDTAQDMFVNGINPDGTVDWRSAGIVSALREAAIELAAEGWVQLERAVVWIAQHYPEQVPAKYGCKTWPQVLHESGRFDLVYRSAEGKRTAFYRPRS